MTNRNNPIPYFDLFDYDSNLKSTASNEKLTPNTSFHSPISCQHCTFHKFKINGIIYKGDANYIDLKVKCMRCGTLSVIEYACRLSE